jgi:hypothetical protein
MRGRSPAVGRSRFGSERPRFLPNFWTRFSRRRMSNQGDWVIRRTPLDSKTFVVPADLTAALAHPDLTPQAPLKQLCATSIIRDEHIAGLNLDLKETERYALLRQAIGATDPETWINRADAIVGHAKRRAPRHQHPLDLLRSPPARRPCGLRTKSPTASSATYPGRRCMTARDARTRPTSGSLAAGRGPRFDAARTGPGRPRSAVGARQRASCASRRRDGEAAPTSAPGERRHTSAEQVGRF